MQIKISQLLLLLLFLSPKILFAQQEVTLDLAGLQRAGKLKIVNRSISAAQDKGVNYIKLSEEQNEGLIWLPAETFSNGSIEITMRGKDVLQKSFIGIVFHGINDTTYDAVYCRPFNFFAKDSVRRIHAIEYISHPHYTWERLRAEHNAMYEKEIQNPPDPNDWFRMKLTINGKTVKAYINDKESPSLVVEKLSLHANGKVGIFVGSGSGGDFEKVGILYQKK